MCDSYHSIQLIYGIKLTRKELLKLFPEQWDKVCDMYYSSSDDITEESDSYSQQEIPGYHKNMVHEYIKLINITLSNSVKIYTWSSNSAKSYSEYLCGTLVKSTGFDKIISSPVPINITADIIWNTEEFLNVHNIPKRPELYIVWIPNTYIIPLCKDISPTSWYRSDHMMIQSRNRSTSLIAQSLNDIDLNLRERSKSLGESETQVSPKSDDNIIYKRKKKKECIIC